MSESLMTNPAILGPRDEVGDTYVFAITADDGLPYDACHGCALTAFCLGQEVRCEGTTELAICGLCGRPIDDRYRDELETIAWIESLQAFLDDLAIEQRAALAS